MPTDAAGPGTALTLAGLAHPGWFGGVMGTAALSKALLAVQLGPFDGAAAAASWVLLLIAALAFVAAVIVQVLSLRRSSDTLRDRIESPILGPLFAAVPGGIFTLLLALTAHDPLLLQRSGFRVAVLALVVLTLLFAFWLTLIFFVAAFESEDFEAHFISGTWFLPETVILLGVLLLSAIEEASSGAGRAALAAATVAVTGAGFVLFLLTAALFFIRMVLERQHQGPGVAAVWIMMSPLSVSSLALGAAAVALPSLADIPKPTVVALISLGSGLLWGFGLWWLVAALLLTIHHGRGALTFTPGSWAYVFPMSAITLAGASLAMVWDSRAVAWVSAVLAVFTLLVWTTVAALAARWVLARGWTH